MWVTPQPPVNQPNLNTVPSSVILTTAQPEPKDPNQETTYDYAARATPNFNGQWTGVPSSNSETSSSRTSQERPVFFRKGCVSRPSIGMEDCSCGQPHLQTEPCQSFAFSTATLFFVSWTCPVFAVVFFYAM